MSSSIKAVLVFLLQTDVFTLNVQVAVGKIPALVLVSSDKTVIQEQILAETTSQTKDSQATALVCSDGDSTNMWRLCIAPKVCHSTILDTSGFFKDHSFDQSRAHGT
ncbi:hypothetical protein BASA84_000962 [Batrachochytrium salamandrivorans]|nr:hypothetical protein BASA84_000962 [Batrachochytrium salamandrivorans]